MNVERMRARAEQAQTGAAQREAAQRQAAFRQTPLGQAVTALDDLMGSFARAILAGAAGGAHPYLRTGRQP